MKKRILIIEDSDEVRENMEEILLLSNYEVTTATNGKEGVEQALAILPDLVICDIMMPVLDGYGVLHLLQKHEATAAIPFIFLTAKAEKTDLRKGMESGADDYLTKPFDGIELLNAVESRLKKQALFARQKQEEPVETDLPDLTGIDREVYSYKKKELVYQEGRKPKAVFYVVKGRVKVFKTNDDGKELIVGVYAAGDFFGYLPILEETNYTNFAEVLEDAELMLVPREDFLQLVKLDKKVAARFIGLMARVISVNEESLLNLAYNSLRKKVAYGLVALAEKYKGANDQAITISMSRETMAQVIGVATESLIRTLTDFKEEKLIQLTAGRVEIIQYEKLKQLPY
jgi:CRP/FNR family cyclic AMP-dependent transcriptional regulator